MTEAIDRKKLKAALDSLDAFEGPHVWVLAAAARAHLATLPESPKTKPLNVWAIDWAFKTSAAVWMPQTTYCLTEAEARGWASREADNELIACVKIYPITREVPDDSD